MRKILFAFSLIFMVSDMLSAQPFKWAKQLSGDENENILDITIDASGSVISTGYFTDKVDFDPGSGSKILTASITSTTGIPDMFIQKLDANGNLLWVKQIGNGEGWEHGDGIKTDAAGNIYVVGQFRGTIDIDPGPGAFTLTSKSTQSYDLFLLKLDAAGNFIWAVQRQSLNDAEEVTVNADIVLDNSSNIYMVYSFYGSSSDRNYMMVEKTTSTGISVWQYKVDATNTWTGGDMKEHSIALDANDSVIVAGTASGDFRFNPAWSFGVSGSYILKLDNSGNYLWVRTLFGTCNIKDIATDVAGNIITAGNFSGIVDFDPGMPIQNDTSSGILPSMFVLKLKNGGDYEWVKNFTGSDESSITGLAIDHTDNIYAVGYFWGQLDFSPSIVKSTMNEDVFTMKLTKTGNLDWVKQMGGSGSCWGEAIALSNAADIYSAGVFQYTANFDMDGSGFYMTKTGPNFISTDAFICKYAACPTFNIQVSQNASVLTASANIGTYQWIDCTNNSLIIGATSNTYIATTTGNYAVVVSHGSCSDTSECFTAFGTSIEEIQSVNSIVLFPNPNSGIFTIKGVGEDASIHIFNSYGQLVKASQSYTGRDININLYEPSGVYFLVISTAYGKRVEKITVY